MARGYIIPIGGAEEKVADAAILRRFVDICGGEKAHIAVIPTASRLLETGPRYQELFRELGAGTVSVLDFESRQDCADADKLKLLSQASGAFLTGGNQLRLSTTLGGTPVAEMFRQRNASGELHVAGTSAGAAILSEHMIAGGVEGSTPYADQVTLAPGLGLTPWAIVDQHFRQRDRLGRLLAALAYNPRPCGIGLDEDTAAFMRPDNTFRVIGSGAITVVDPSQIEFTSMDSSRRSEPVTIIGARLHVLTHGDTYDIINHIACPVADRAKV
jgi:cyanophycinase